MNNYFAIEPLLISFLQQKVEGLSVHSLSNLDQLAKQEPDQTPAALVTFEGAARTGERTINQQWVVAVVVGNTEGDAAASRAEAGGVVSIVAKALNDARLAEGFSALRFERTYRPVVTNSFVAIPMLFTTTAVAEA